MKIQHHFKRNICFSLFGTLALMVLAGICLPTPAFAAGEEQVMAEAFSENYVTALKWGVIAAAIAFGLGAIGAGLAISRVGAAAMGAMSEKPEIGSQALIFVAMAEGIAVFGFIAALMILGKF